MFYIHQSTCISPQQTFGSIDLVQLKESTDNKLYAIEPAYMGISPGLIRRMGKAVRMGVGSALPLLQQHKTDGIIIGTANGGIEDSLKFLSQIMEYEEGTLTPTNFVQSTYNAIAGQLGMIAKNTGYNSTHVHRGHAFENVMIDADMMLAENPDNSYLIGAVDEISERNHRMERMDGWYKNEPVLNVGLYETKTAGTLPGEGAAMFIASNKNEGAVAKLVAVRTINTDDVDLVTAQLGVFLGDNKLQINDIDLLLSGENGDIRLKKYYDACEQLFAESTTVARYKHTTGEFQTSTALAVWITCQFMQMGNIPEHFIKTGSTDTTRIKHVLIYNNYKGNQHSFILLERV